MPAWDFAIALDSSDDAPIFLQIARALIDEIRRGRLRPGDAIPGSRALPALVGVHRNTVLAAYRELIAEGWLTGEPARGTFISRELPDVVPRPFGARPRPVAKADAAARVGYDLPARRADEIDEVKDAPPGALSLSGGIPDIRLAP